MPDIYDSSKVDSSQDSTPAGASQFSFQNQPSDATSDTPQPAAPFETISLQTPNEEQKPREQDQVTTPEPAAATAPPTSFLERYKNELPPVDEAAKSPSLEESFGPSQPAPLTEEPTKPPPTDYQMPELPKQSIFARLLPFALFFLVIGGAIFLGLKFLPQFQAPKKVELTWWGLWEDEKTMKVLIDSYTRQKPNVTIIYKKENPRDYRTRLQTEIARGTGPDIFRFHNTWPPMLRSELGAMPEKLKAEIDFTNTFYPAAYYDLVRENKIYGIPLMFEGLALYYNADMFQNAGISPPSTWDEVYEAAKKLTVKDGENENLKISGIALGNTNVEHWSDIVGAMLLQNGADPSLPTDTCAKEAIDYYVSFALSTPKIWDDTLGNSTLAFVNSRAAMYIGPSWEAFEIKKMNPNLNFKIAPFPQIPSGKKFWATYWVEGVNAKSKNAAEAWDFLSFAAKKESLQVMYSESVKSSSDRLFGEIYPRVDMASLVKDDLMVSAYLTGAKEARGWYLASRTFDDGINDRVIKYYEDAINKIVAHQASTEDALKTVAAGMDQILKEYSITIPTSNPNCKVTSQ